MRRLLTQLEQLPAGQFVFEAGVTGGLIEGVSFFLVEAFRSSGSLFVAVMLDGVFSVLWFGAAIVFCIAAVRRLRFSVWMTALHLALALLLVHLIRIGFVFAFESIETRVELVTFLTRSPLIVVTSNIFITAIRFPADFLVAALVVALGRYFFQQRSEARLQPTNPA